MARRPRIGPCRDPLHLWFLEWADARGVWRRYFASRDEAREARKAHRRKDVEAPFGPESRRRCVVRRSAVEAFAAGRKDFAKEGQ